MEPILVVFSLMVSSANADRNIKNNNLNPTETVEIKNSRSALKKRVYRLLQQRSSNWLNQKSTNHGKRAKITLQRHSMKTKN